MAEDPIPFTSQTPLTGEQSLGGDESYKLLDGGKVSEPPGDMRRGRGSTQFDMEPHLRSGHSRQKRFALRVKAYWKTAVVVLTPLLALPIPLLWDDPKGKAAFVLVLMATYWCTEAIPLAATALIPIFLVPALGLLPAKQISKTYMPDLNFLFMSGLMFAVAVEKSNLHKRIALRVLLLVGTRPIGLLFGFVSVTGILSMWLSNTATTAMMIPIAEAVLVEIRRARIGRKDDDMEMSEERNGTSSSSGPAAPVEPENEDDEEEIAYRKLCKAVSLSICYAANIGGTGTLTGTGPNLLVGQTLVTSFGEDSNISYLDWMVVAIPLMLICLVIAWLVLSIGYLGPRSLVSCCGRDKKDVNIRGVINREYRLLGPVRFAEVSLMVLFLVLVTLWLSRDPKFAPGWSSLFMPKYMADACSGMLICTVLFAFPSSFPCCGARSGDGEDEEQSYELGPPLLDWKTVHERLPWGVLILLGGGFALAEICKTSGLSSWMGCQLVALENVPVPALVIICCLLMAGFTEFTSNTSSASIFLPILANLAVTLDVHPLYIMVPVTMCASYAFMFPVATPPNAIVFAYGHLRVIDMVKTGIFMNIFCITAVTLAINTWGYAYFDLGNMPAWVAKAQNSTSC